jgi:hypothetical protein
MVSKTPEIPQFPHVPQLVRTVPGQYPIMIYPSPPHFSPHAYENNEVTSIMTRSASENKQLTSQILSEIGHFALGMQRL